MLTKASLLFRLYELSESGRSIIIVTAKIQYESERDENKADDNTEGNILWAVQTRTHQCKWHCEGSWTLPGLSLCLSMF